MHPNNEIQIASLKHIYIIDELTASKYSLIGIVGGGIGGLAAANALLHRPNLTDRVSVSIYDQASEFIPTAGAAGFGLSPNGQICRSSIGINGYRDVYQPVDTMKRSQPRAQAQPRKNK
jgi:2-polyprenyl-6-methoxyphenol hydroxylase-like FAD-dependent oxidoreductase